MKNPFMKQENVEKTVFHMIQDRGNGFYSWNGRLYQSDIIRACIKPQTKAIGKLLAKHVRTTLLEDGTKKTEINPMAYIKFLLEEPNEFMTGQMLQEKVANQLALNANAFILIIRDSMGLPCGLYPIPAISVEAKYDLNHELYLKMYYQNGKYSEFYYKDIIHIRDDFYSNDLFGEAPNEALKEIMESLTVIDQGLRNAIKNSGIVKWLLKFTQPLHAEDMKVRAETFAENYLSISSNKVGVAATDTKADVERIEPKDYVPNAAISDKQKQRVYAFFGTNEKIVMSTYTEDEWISYYEARIEPFGRQMSEEYTRKLFSRRQRDFGNRIIFESSSLTFASMKSKLELVSYVDRGIMTPNEVREYIGLAPIPGGDEALLRKDTGFMTGGDENAENNTNKRHNRSKR